MKGAHTWAITANGKMKQVDQRKKNIRILTIDG
jgi:hypothetical protein